MNTVNRFWELDFLRGAAIIAMIFFHFVFDIQYFVNTSFNLDQTSWVIFARSIAITFILLVGICMVISYEKNKRKKSIAKTQKKLIKRAFLLLFFASLISLFTYIFTKINKYISQKIKYFIYIAVNKNK